MIRSRIALFGVIAFVSVLCGYLYTSSTSINIGYVRLGQVESNRSLDRFREPPIAPRPVELPRQIPPSVSVSEMPKQIAPSESASKGARLHLITQFPVINTSGPDGQIAEERQKELVYSLEKNLLSPHVEKIHLFCETDHDDSYIKSLKLKMDWKLVFRVLGRRLRYKDAFQYASQNLIGKNAMIMNADCYVDQGFEHLDENKLGNKTMYSLTRHEKLDDPSHHCDGMRDFCGPQSAYQGSHDAWLFRLLDPISSKVLDNIDYRPNLGGIEQVLMFYLRTEGGFIIKNPCKILHIVHHHCVRLPAAVGNEQEVGGQRLDHKLGLGVGAKGGLVLAGFSDL